MIRLLLQKQFDLGLHCLSRPGQIDPNAETKPASQDPILIWTKMVRLQWPSYFIKLILPVATFVICSHVLMSLGSLFCKHQGPRMADQTAPF